MRPGKLKSPDPLAGIEEMLSSLCGEQNHRLRLPEENIEDAFWGEADQGAMGGNNMNDVLLTADEGPPTPEKITDSRDTRQRRGQANRQTRSNVSKRLPPSTRIRKLQKVTGKLHPDQRSSFKTNVPRAFGAEVNEQERDILDASSDDPDNMKFLHQMKSLAEEQLDVHERKTNAMNMKAINSMRHHTNQCFDGMKRIAGNVSRDIIDRAGEIEDALPRKVSEQIAKAMNAVSSAKDGFSDFLAEAKLFEDDVNKLVQQLHMQRKENKEKHNVKEQRIYANAKAICASGQRLTSVLRKIDKMLGVANVAAGQ